MRKLGIQVDDDLRPVLESIMSSKMIMGLLANPKNRRKLVSGLRYVGQNGVRAIQKNRQRRGKARMWAKVPAYRINSNKRVDSVAVPVRINAAQQVKNADVREVRTELTSLTITPNATAQGVTGRRTIDCLNTALWPMLASKAINYTRWSIQALRVKYRPIAGSAISGQVTFGVCTQSLTTDELVQTPSQISSLPFSMTLALGKDEEFTIPVSLLSHGGKDLMVPLPAVYNEGTVYNDPTLYYGGTFVWNAYQCSVQSGSLPASAGTLSFSYVITLSSQVLDVSASTTTVEFDASNNLTVLKPGRTIAKVESDTLLDLHSLRTIRPVVSQLLTKTHELYLNGVLLTAPTAIDGATHSLWFYPAIDISAPSILEVNNVTAGGTISLVEKSDAWEFA